MSRITVGDASLTNILARQGAALRGQVNQAAQEVTTGRSADVGKALRGDFSPLLAIDASLARLEAFRRTAADAATLTAAQQSVLAAIGDQVSQAAVNLVQAGDFATAAQVDTLGADARSRLAGVIGLLNTQVAGRAVFAGDATTSTPLGSVEDLLTALTAAAAGATTADQVVTAVTDWFGDPGGYAAFYQGGGPLTPAPIAAGEAADQGTTALDPALRDTLAGLALGALLDRGVLAGRAEERATLARRSGEALLTAGDARVALGARIGAVEARIEAAQTRNAAEATALGLVRSDTGAVDPYDAAARLEEARSQLESLYLVTARVARLNLAEFLR